MARTTVISRAPVLFIYAAGTLMKHFTLSVLTKELHYSYFQNFLLQKITLLRESKHFFSDDQGQEFSC